MNWRIAALFFVWVMLAQADTVVLRNGTTVKGVWMGADSDKIRLLVDGQVKAYARADVSAVTFGDESATASVPAGGSNTPVNAPTAEPERTNVVYLRDDSGKLIPLEKDRAKLRGNPFDPGGMDLRIDGAKSAVRLKYGQKIVFVVKLETPTKNESKILQFWELESNTKKDHRLADFSGYNRPAHFPFDSTKTGDAVYLTPKKNLPPGEYAFVHARYFFCFGVDDEKGSTTP